MFIALRDLAYAKGRFALMALVIALIAFLMTFLTGLVAGLIKNNISGLMELDVSHIAFEFDDKPTYRNTMIERDQWEEWAQQRTFSLGRCGVEDSTPSIMAWNPSPTLTPPTA